MTKLNEKHLQKGEYCAAHSSIDNINLQAVNILDLKLKHFVSSFSTTLNGQFHETKYSALILGPKLPQEI